MNFRYCIIKPFKKGWGVFSIPPINDKEYIWFIQRYEDTFISTPMWTDTFKDKLKSLSKEECIQLARDYDKFCDNSEWF